MEYTLRLSHSASGVNLYLCKNSFRRFAEISQRWSFSYDQDTRTFSVRPDPRDGWKLSDHNERDNGRIFGPDDCIDMPEFGVIPFVFETLDPESVMLKLPSFLPAMRVVRSNKGNSIDGRKCEVILTLMERDLSFSVPEGELLDVVMNWTRSGYSS